MSAAVSTIGGILGALAVISAGAFAVRGIARVLLLGQVVYWLLSYVARPAVLLWVQPQPGYGDDLADPRLALIGYDHGITEALQPVVLGLWLYAAIIAAYATWTRDRAPLGLVRSDAEFTRTLLVIYVIGGLARAAALLTGQAGSAGEVASANPVLDLLAGLATVGSLGLILFLRLPGTRTTMIALGGLLAVELAWAIAVESKSPIIAAALGVAIRFALLGWTRRRTLGAVGLGVVGLAGFGWLQSFKLTSEARSAAATVDEQYPAAVQPFLSILRRFDLLQAATDVYYMDGRPWLDVVAVLGAAWRNLVPSALLGDEKLHSGTAWASEVRGASVDMSNVSVSLAEGNINEGFLLGGYFGLGLGVAFTFALLLLTVRALHSSHIAVITLGVVVATSPVLDERGFLGSTEVLGKGVQLAAAVWAIDLAVRTMYRPPQPEGRPTNGDEPERVVDRTTSMLGPRR